VGGEGCEGGEKRGGRSEGGWGGVGVGGGGGVGERGGGEAGIVGKREGWGV